MKKHLLAVSLFVFAFTTQAQWVSIPDSNFGKWLYTSGYANCLQGNSTSGWLMDTTCSTVVFATTINCYGKSIKDLNGIQYFDRLTNLSCEMNQLNSLPSLPNSLITLDCNYNQLTALPSLPNLLKRLSCYSNLLTSLPALPNSLNSLSCDFNQISVLPILPNALRDLYCGYNTLMALPTLPDSLNLLNCTYNQLTVLPTLPSALYSLYCPENLLTALPMLPNSLNWLICNNNQLTSIPELSDSLAFFDCHGNVNLTCLPYLKKIKTFQFYNTGITCLPNYPQSNSNSSPLLSSLPICDSLNNPNICQIYTPCSAHYTLYPDSIILHNWFLLIQANGNGPFTYLWNWGDGTNSTGAYPSHTYSTAGNYNICLSISDSTGCSDTYCDSSTYIYKTEDVITVSVVNQLPTGITETQTNEVIGLYPNPATDQAQLLFTVHHDQAAEFTVTDSKGSIISRRTLQFRAGKNLYNFRTADWASGVYLITIQNQELKWSSRLVKE